MSRTDPTLGFLFDGPSPDLYQTLLDAHDQLGDAVFVRDEAGRLVFVNEAACRLVGWSREELLSMESFVEVVDPAERRRVAEMSTRRLSGDEVPRHYESSLRHRLGHAVAVEISAGVVEDGPRYVVAVVRDISHRKQQERVLRDRARQQAAVAALGAKALGDVDVLGLLQNAARAVARTLRVDYAQVLELEPDGRSLLLRAGLGWKRGLVGRAMVPAGERSLAGHTLASARPVIVRDLSREQRFDAPELLTSHGVTSGLSVVIPGEERPFGVIGAHTRRARAFTADDVNFLQAVAHTLGGAVRRLRVQDALRDSEARYRELFENALDLVFTTDLDGRITAVNRAARRVLGYEPDEVLGMNVVDLASPQHRPAVRRLLDLAPGVADGDQVRALPSRHELELLARDGRRVTVEAVIRLIHEGGRPVGVQGIARDVSERKAAETALRRSEQQFRSLIDNALDIIATLDEGLHVTYASPSVQRVLGYRPEELRGRNIVDLIHPHDVASVQDAFDRRAEDRGEGVAMEVRVRHAGGSWRLIEGIGRNLLSDPAVRGIVVNARDVTERKRIEERLQVLSETGDLLSSSFDEKATIDGLAALAVPRLADWCVIQMIGEGGIVERTVVRHSDPERRRWAQEFVDALPPREVRATPLREVLATGKPLLLPRISEAQLREAASDDETLEVVRRMDLRSGIVVPLLGRDRPLGLLILVAGESGRIYGVEDLGVAEEVAGRASQALESARLFRRVQDSEERFRSMVEGVRDHAVYAIDPEGRLVSWNPTAERIFGHRAEEIVGAPIRTLYPPEAAASAAKGLERAAASGWSEEEGWRLRKDGSRFWAHVTTTARHDEHGALRGFSRVTRDITERKRTEQGLRFLTEASEALATSLDVDDSLAEVARLSVPRLADICIVYVRAKAGPIRRLAIETIPELREELHEALEGHDLDPRATAGVPEVIRSGEALFHPDADASMFSADVMDPDSQRRALEPVGIRSWVCVPLMAGGSTFGAISFLSLDEHRRYGQRELALVRELARLAGLAADNARLFEEAQKSLAQLRRTDQERRRLLADLVTAQEEERGRIAGEIHDDSLQIMVAVSMRLQMLARKMDPEHLEGLRRLEETVALSVSRLRSLMFELHPPALDQEGLTAAIRSYVEAFQAEGPLDVHVEDGLTAEPPPTIRTLLYRIAQEALANVRKHARARSVRVMLREEGDGVRIEIRDDGVGFAPDEVDPPPPGHLGLVAMRERAQIAGGWCRIQSAPGRGTTVRYWLPARDRISGGR
ncbi:MAG TPA: PAS domain S-box protein [Actinomycetota bacterium]|nr:PAS domain S-box protein [Actinomycetota bacterium]